MESDQLEELINELSQVQDALAELCPDIEKIEPNISVIRLIKHDSPL